MSESVESAGDSSSSSEPTAEVGGNERVVAETYPLFSQEQLGEVAGVDSDPSELHRLKVSGEEKRVPYDELVKMAQKGEAADQKFRETADMKKRFTSLEQENNELKQSTQALMKQLKDDPFSVLSHESLGLDLDSLLYDKMNEKMEYEEMDEYERENHDLRQRLERYETQEKKVTEEKKQTESMARQNQYANNIAAALQEAGISPTQDTIRVAASHLYQSSAETGYPTMTWKEMVDRTKGSLKQEAKQVYGSLPPEQLAEYLGDDVIQKIRKHDIQKVKKNFSLNQPDVNPENVRRVPKTAMSKAEFRERMNKIKQSLA